jgi:hypothetical protein
VVKRKPKRRVKPELPELDEELYREKPVVYTDTKMSLEENGVNKPKVNIHVLFTKSHWVIMTYLEWRSGSEG